MPAINQRIIRRSSWHRRSSDGSAHRMRIGRAAFTMIELVVVLGVIGLLLALILPAVQQARSTARRMQCQNNLRNLALAIQQQTQTATSFPPAGYFSSTSPTIQYGSWVIAILPFVEQTAIYNQWNKNGDFRESPNKELATTHLPVLVCPSDISAVGQGDLSYALNGGIGWTAPPCGVHNITGIVDLDGDGGCIDGKPDPDREFRYKMGVFFVDNYPTRNPSFRQHTVNSILDGQSNTLMMSENIHAGYDPTSNGNWASPAPWENSFFMSPGICRDLSCVPGAVDYRNANIRTGPFRMHSINPPVQTEGGAPFASSYHTGGVNVAFLDGRVTFLKETVDGGVYAALLSPQGTRIEGPLAQGILTEFE